MEIFPRGTKVIAVMGCLPYWNEGDIGTVDTNGRIVFDVKWTGTDQRGKDHTWYVHWEHLKRFTTNSDMPAGPKGIPYWRRARKGGPWKQFVFHGIGGADEAVRYVDQSSCAEWEYTLQDPIGLPAKHGMFWSHDDDRLLKEMYHSGVEIPNIAAKLQRLPNAITCRLEKHGYTKFRGSIEQAKLAKHHTEEYSAKKSLAHAAAYNPQYTPKELAAIQAHRSSRTKLRPAHRRTISDKRLLLT